MDERNIESKLFKTKSKPNAAAVPSITNDCCLLGLPEFSGHKWAYGNRRHTL